MSIKLAHNCINCENLQEGGFCKKHLVKVGVEYTCDSFIMKAAIVDERNCLTCGRFEDESCANPEKAAPAMLCASWAPQAEA